jgi:hypothetical protein
MDPTQIAPCGLGVPIRRRKMIEVFGFDPTRRG